MKTRLTTRRLKVLCLLLAPVTMGLRCGGSTEPPPAEGEGSLTLSPTTVSIEVGEQTTVEATLLNGAGNVVTQELTWTLSSEGYVLVEGNGYDTRTLTGVSPGEVTITASFQSLSATTRVTVTGKEVTRVDLSAPARTVILGAGEEEQLTAMARDEDGAEVTYANFTWSTSDPNVLSVDGQGLVTTVGHGVATVTATSGSASRTSDEITVMQVISVDGGFSNTCAMAMYGNSRRAYCWGWNGDGQLGDGTTNPQYTPHRVLAPEGDPWVTIDVAGAAQQQFACGLTESGNALCWGDNHYGSIGIGSFGDSKTPVLVSGGHVWDEISVGAEHVCAITNYDLYCWGRGSFGQLGNGSVANQRAPVKVPGDEQYSTVYAGTSHTCANVVVTLSEDSKDACWGWGTEGQLGDGNSAGSTTPVVIDNSLGFAQIAPGFLHTCGIGAADEIMCWGDNDKGQIGDGSGSRQSTPVLTSLGLNADFHDIASGRYHTCALEGSSSREGGATYCWGSNTFGALQGFANLATPLVVVGEFTQIEAGSHHTCGITGTGVLYCWGGNDEGAIGNGERSSTPVREPYRVVFPEEQVSSN